MSVVSVVADLSLDMTVSPSSLTDGERMQVMARARNVGTDTANDVSLRLDVREGGFLVDRIESGAASCSVTADDYFQCIFTGGLSCGVYERSRVECAGFGAVPSGSEFELRFSGIAHAPGGTIESRVYGTNDPDYRNDSASLALAVGPPGPPPAPTPFPQPAASSGGGGGGSIDGLSVAMLALALAAVYARSLGETAMPRRRRRASCHNDGMLRGGAPGGSPT